MRIASVAYALPSRRVDNESIIQRVLADSAGFSDEEKEEVEAKIRAFFRLSGSSIRYHRAPGEKALDFGVKAGRSALEKAGVRAADVDLLIYAGVGRGWLEPATANAFQAALGLENATCFDVLDACASWIRSLSIARSFLHQKTYRRVLVLNCEFNVDEYVGFRLDSPRDIDNFFSGYTIGEGAAATLLERGGEDDDFFFTFRSWGDKHVLCNIPLDNAAQFSDGPHRHSRAMTFFTRPTELIGFTTERMVEQFRATPELTGRRYDLMMGHAVGEGVNARAFESVGLDPSRVYETHARFGNTVSATLPIGLAAAEEAGRLERGMRVLLAMGSAGVTTAFSTFKY